MWSECKTADVSMFMVVDVDIHVDVDGVDLLTIIWLLLECCFAWRKCACDWY